MYLSTFGRSPRLLIGAGSDLSEMRNGTLTSKKTQFDKCVTGEQLETMLTEFFRQQVVRYGFEGGLRGGGKNLESARERAVETIQAEDSMRIDSREEE